LIKKEIMAFTFHINDSNNPKVIAFMEYVKSLDFVKIVDDEVINYPSMSDEEIIQRVFVTRKEVSEGKYISQDELLEKIKKW
jgi:ABC-type thiamine transport system substrate-binding protein